MEKKIKQLLLEEDNEWTRRVTILRREAWNAWVHSQSEIMNAHALEAHCKKIGYDYETLKRHVIRHGLLNNG